jgi:hypothetical protein
LLLAVSSALWSSSTGGGQVSPRVHSPELLPFQSSSRVSPLLILADRHSGQLLSWTFGSLRRQSGPRIHISDRVPILSSFRLQGLATLLTAYSPETLVSLISCSPRPWDSPLRSLTFAQGVPMSPPERTHLPFLLRLTRRSADHARPRKPQLLGFHPRTRR